MKKDNKDTIDALTIRNHDLKAEVSCKQVVITCQFNV